MRTDSAARVGQAARVRKAAGTGDAGPAASARVRGRASRRAAALDSVGQVPSRTDSILPVVVVQRQAREDTGRAVRGVHRVDLAASVDLVGVDAGGAGAPATDRHSQASSSSDSYLT